MFLSVLGPSSPPCSDRGAVRTIRIKQHQIHHRKMNSMTYPNPPSWPAPSYAPQAVPEQGTNGLAVASLVLSICGLLFLWVIGPILAVIFGHVSLGQIKRNREGGRGMAIAGIVMGWIGTAVTILFVILIIAAAASSSGGGS
jgi:hypothetical protein